jgi:predicted S18 family serine protease
MREVRETETGCEVNIEKLKAAKEVYHEYHRGIENLNFNDWVQAEINRMEDPWAEAKTHVKDWKQSRSLSISPRVKSIIKYVDHLENELAHYKIQYQHTKEAAAEPLDAKRVLATAINLIGMLDVSDTRKEMMQSGIQWTINKWNTKPYEVKECP